MTDRLAAIKNMIANVKVSEHQYEAERLDRVKAVQAIVWLIAQVERLEVLPNVAEAMMQRDREIERLKAECECRENIDGPRAFKAGKEAAAKIAEECLACVGTVPSKWTAHIAAAIRGSINDPAEAEHGNKQFLSGFRARETDDK